MRTLALLAIAAATLSAQTRPAFEVASVKPGRPGCTGPGPRDGPSPGRLELPCLSLRNLIQAAYGMLAGDKLNIIPMQVLGGPGWIDTDRYDVSAKAEGKVPAAQMVGPMLQALLEERFQLKLHVEPKESPVYFLVLAKATPKFSPSKEGSCIPLDLSKPWTPAEPGATQPIYCGMPKTTFKNNVMIADVSGATMEEFAGRILSSRAGRPVLDKTGLTGRYDLHLEFSMDNMGAPIQLNGVPQAPPAADRSAPSLFTAIQEQLGLKLSSDKAPVNVIRVDSAAKPDAN